MNRIAGEHEKRRTGKQENRRAGEHENRVIEENRGTEEQNRERKKKENISSG